MVPDWMDWEGWRWVSLIFTAGIFFYFGWDARGFRSRRDRQDALDLQRTFDLRWNADRRAIKRWQEANPGREHVWPDHADLVVWLMDRHDEVTDG